MKMINETKKIMHMPELPVAATCVRLPVVSGHSESVYIEIDKDRCNSRRNKNLFEMHLVLFCKMIQKIKLYPMPANCVGKNDVFVGRIRKDLDEDKGFHIWVVSDNLLKGAAWNSVQIAESLLSLELVK